MLGVAQTLPCQGSIVRIDGHMTYEPLNCQGLSQHVLDMPNGAASGPRCKHENKDVIYRVQLFGLLQLDKGQASCGGKSNLIRARSVITGPSSLGPASSR